MIRLDLPWPNAIVIRDVENLESWFDPAELAIVNAFEREKRRQEWMLARVALKILQNEHTFSPGEGGAQRRVRGEQPGARIRAEHTSLSHSGPYAAAAIDDQPVGVDVQIIKHLSERAAHLFLSPAEERAMHCCTIEHRLIHFFSAKEAAWKALGGATPTLRRVPLQLVDQTEAGLRFDRAETVAIGDVVVALTRPTS
jgi:phosphopantetheinyl transferase